MVSTEVDVVVVGGRVAGTPTAIELARRGRTVVVFDAATFPSDTLSTHVIFPSGVAEIQSLGALDRLLAGGTPKCPHVMVVHGGYHSHWTFTAVDGVDYTIAPTRPHLDTVLVETAREAGVDVREGTKVVDLVWERGRVAGVRWQDRTGATGEVRCQLVVGADGRRSTVADLVGAREPYRRHPNGRGLVFMYVDDPAPSTSGERATMYQWRVGDTLGFYFPSDDDGALVLFMCPKEQVADFRQDLATWDAMLDRFPALKERIGGGAPRSRLRKATDTFSYFRRSSGPGWALVGDAGHFKDPVIANGIRDALFYGRRLGIAVADVLDDRELLDRRLWEWELTRDRGCISTYYLGLRLTTTQAVTPVEVELFRDLEGDDGLSREMSDVFNRVRTFEEWFTYPRAATWALRATRRSGATWHQVLHDGTREMRFRCALLKDLAQLRRGRRADGSTFTHWTPGPAPERTVAPSIAPGGGRPAEPQANEVEEVVR